MRKFTTYETNLLLKFGFDPFKLASEVEADIPVEYITGKAEFYGNIFEVNENTLIPRIESEAIVNLALLQLTKILKERTSESKKRNTKVNFMDIGSGSGAIGISLANELVKQNIPHLAYFIDISNEALEVCFKNAQKILTSSHLYKEEIYPNNISPKIQSAISILNPEDGRADLNSIARHGPSILNLFDIIVANLPYIPTDRINNLQPSVKNYEPLLALDGGKDGLDVIRKVLKDYKPFLASDGVFILEVDDTHDRVRAKEFEDWDIEVSKDSNEKVRYWICKSK